MLGWKVVLFLYFAVLLTDGRRPKYILLYTKLTNNKLWHLSSPLENQTYFEKFNCPETNCIITTNRTYLANIKDYDLIAMSSWNVVSLADFPPPDTRHSDQIYLMHYRESPIRTKMELAQFSHLINWTMSFRLDADVFIPYGQFEETPTKRLISPALNPMWRTPDFKSPITRDPELIELVEEKSKLAAWFVSNCFAPSKRRFIVQKMQQYMTVDVYGKCGTLNCNKSDRSSCRNMVERDYKFYLSFENSLCTDYITEKVFTTMKNFVVPVVYGGVDYNRFLPPHSYINVADYDSVEDLVQYLHYLANNTEEYMKYFWWKDYYTVTDLPRMCGICEKINQVGERPSFVKYYTDLDQWFKNGTCFDEKKIPLVYKVLKEFKRIKD